MNHPQPRRGQMNDPDKELIQEISRQMKQVVTLVSKKPNGSSELTMTLWRILGTVAGIAIVGLVVLYASVAVLQSRVDNNAEDIVELQRWQRTHP